MIHLLSIAVVAITAFISTNLDDILLLMIWFSQPTSDHHSKFQVIIGQYLGFTCLILFSIPGIFTRSLVSNEYLGLLGLIPLFIGLRFFLTPEKQSDQSTEIQFVNLPNNLTQIINPQIMIIAAVTIANGGDNIAIYLPLFASHTWQSLTIILVVFYIMLGLWCYLANWLINRSTLANTINRNITQFIPWLLIFLGIYIMVENGTYKLIWN